MARLWKSNFGWRPSLVDSRALTGLGGSSLTPRLDIPPQPAEMDTWWRVNGEENTLWSRVEILFWDEPRGAAFTQFGQKILQLFRRKVMNMIKYDPFKTFPALAATDFCHAVSKYERSKMFLLCY